MNWLQRLVARVLPQQPSAERVYIPVRTQAGQNITEDTAMRYAAVWRCVDVIAKAIAILPWCVYEKTKTGRKDRDDHTVSWLLHHQPNPEMQPYVFKHLLASHLLTWGNAYCEIQRDTMGRPLWLWPITPDRVTPRRVDDGSVAYEVSNVGAGKTLIPAIDVLHIRGMGFDGLVGYSPIRMAAESVGLGLAMDQMAAGFFGNGANMGGVLKHPKKLSPEARKNLEDSWQRASAGKNAGRWLVAEEGMEPERMSIPPNEAQFLESRKHQIMDICRWFGVPPHKVGALDRSTWNNIEHQELEFVTDTVQPWVTQFEEEANLKLFGRVNRGVLYTKFNLSALLRGDAKSRSEVYEIGHRNGWLCADEIRAFEEMNPLPKGLGKMYVMQAQMATREQIKEGKQQKTAPNPGDAVDEPPTDPVDRLIDAARVLNLARKQG